MGQIFPSSSKATVSWRQNKRLKILHFFLQVPFVESPKYAPQRRESARTLVVPHPHPFLRANSDSSMNLPDWMAVPNAPGTNIVSVQVNPRTHKQAKQINHKTNSIFKIKIIYQIIQLSKTECSAFGFYSCECF